MTELGIPSGDDDPLLVHVDGANVEHGDVRVHLRRSRTVRVSIDANADYCRQLLRERYGLVKTDRAGVIRDTPCSPAAVPRRMMSSP